MTRRTSRAHADEGGRPARGLTPRQGAASSDGAGTRTDRKGIPGVALLPLRAFLGTTFAYAGIQKIQDPGFFRLGSPTYIGTQLVQFSHGSPVHFLLSPFLEHSEIIGILTIFTELLVGLLVIVGLFTRAAALTGLAVNFILFLSASWHVYPYFLGSDIVFVAAWLTLVLAGPGGFAADDFVQPSLWGRLSPLLLRLLFGPLASGAQEEGSPQSSTSRDSVARPGTGVVLLSRIELIAGSMFTAVLIGLGLWPRAKPSGQVANRAAAPSSAHASTPRTPIKGKKIGNVSQVPENSAGSISDPQTGDPAIIVHTSGSSFYAYDAICTHAGCTVQYDAQSKLIVCPCHGAAFDPARQAEVVAGPAPSPLTSLPIQIDQHGNIYLV